MREYSAHKAQRILSPTMVLFPDNLPTPEDTTPLSVRIGRTLSATLLLPWPFALLAAVMSLGDASGSLWERCSSGWLGLFACTSAAYPLLFLLSTVVSRLALKAKAVALAVFAAWTPVVGMVYLAWGAGFFARVYSRS
jgi:hypothetical protein